MNNKTTTTEPAHKIFVLFTLASSESSDEPGHRIVKKFTFSLQSGPRGKSTVNSKFFARILFS